jgi:hypothetical protein
VVQLAQQVKRGDPVFGVRSARERDRARRRLVAVAAGDHVDGVEIADAAVLGGLGKVLFGLEHRRSHRHIGHLGLVEKCVRAGVIERLESAQLLGARALHENVLAPAERGNGQCDTKCRHDRTEHHGRPA